MIVKTAAAFDFYSAWQLTHYLDTELTPKYVDRIRELSGYLLSLVSMFEDEATKEMALYLFDQKLSA